ncbi:hypothetical protein [Fulvimarina manganoxydans]|uniref:hypothetical protein n=1 Tax=Fulvimarina manganoxydans TaxID=937218 RepID=UPI00111C0026|nr:hypothetical protein [Fulvimarina manganoxydans]
MSVEDIKVEVRTGWSDVPAADLCLRIIDFLAARREDELRMLTFRELSVAAGVDDVDAELLTAVAILRNLSVLDARALLVDADEMEYEIDPSDLAEAHLTGELVHPHTGELVENYAGRLVPFFVPTKRFLAESNSV